MNQLKAGAALNYVVIVLNMLVGLLYTPYMLRMMGQSEYGLYSLVASIISYLTVLDLGLGNAIVRYTAKFRAEGKITEQYEMFGMFLLLYIVIGIVAFILGLGLYFNVNTLFGATMTIEELDKARIMMIFLVLNLAVTFPMSIFGSIITAYERFVFPKVINIVRIILNTVIMICLLEMGYKAIAMVVLQTTFNMLTLIINYFYCKYKLQIKVFYRNFQWGFLKEVGIYSFWIFLNAIMSHIYGNTGQFVLGIFSGTAAVAVFALAIQLEHMYMQFSTGISSVFLPKITAMVALSDNRKEISNLFVRTGRIQYIVISLILFGFIVFGRQFINLWAGSEYNDAYIITLLFFIGLFPPLIQNIGVIILQARNQMKFRSLLYIAIAMFGLVFQVLLAKPFGGVGCAMAIACAYLLGNGLIINIYYYKKQDLDILAFWKEIFRMSFLPVCICIVAKYILTYVALDTWFSLGISVAIFLLIYIPIFFRFSMKKEERNLFIRPIKRIVYKIRQ